MSRALASGTVCEHCLRQHHIRTRLTHHLNRVRSCYLWYVFRGELLQVSEVRAVDTVEARERLTDLKKGLPIMQRGARAFRVYGPCPSPLTKEQQEQAAAFILSTGGRTRVAEDSTSAPDQHVNLQKNDSSASARTLVEDEVPAPSPLGGLTPRLGLLLTCTQVDDEEEMSSNFLKP